MIWYSFAVTMIVAAFVGWHLNDIEDRWGPGWAFVVLLTVSIVLGGLFGWVFL